MRKLVSSVILAFIGATIVQGADFKKLEGEYALVSRHVIDPAPTDVPTRVLLLIGGTGAKEIFEAMPGPILTRDCAGEPGRTVARKEAGGLECEISRERMYSCSVGIALDSGRTSRGYVCD